MTEHQDTERIVISQATQILQQLSRGDQTQREELFAVVYDDLRKVAEGYVRRERPGPDLQATDVVHEVYLRLIDQKSVSWQDRSHFFAIGAHVMRHVLVDNARKRMAEKRGGKAQQISMDLVEKQITVSPNSETDVLAVDNAIALLAESNEQRSQIVELRFFGGLKVEEIAVALGVSKSTVEREWRVARAWLRRELSPSTL